MGRKKRFSPRYDRWTPADQVMDAINKCTLVRDKVEVLFAHFANDHGGQGASAYEIARILRIARQNIQRRMDDLIDEGRAIRRHGKFYLILHSKTHPSVRHIVRRLSRGVVVGKTIADQSADAEGNIAITKIG